MKQRKWTVDWMKDISWVSKFIHKYLKLDPEEKIVRKKITSHCIFKLLINVHFQFLYINQTFAPSPDQILKNLYECYGNQNNLSLHYSINQAWG